MKPDYFFAVGTIGLSKQKAKPVSLLAAAKHNKREIRAEFGPDKRFDSCLKDCNKVIAGPATADEVVKLATSLMLDAGIDPNRLRKDYTQAIELIFSLPAETTLQVETYFEQCVNWTRLTFGKAVVLSADIHNDESMPHCHVLVLPLREGKRVGGALINRTALKKLTDSFFLKVAQLNGLRRPIQKLHGQSKKEAVRLIFEKLKVKGDPLLNSCLIAPITSEIARNPGHYMDLLCIDIEEVRPRKLKSFVSIMTSKGKGAAVDPDFYSSVKLARAKGNPIDIAEMEKEQQHLSCVGVAI
jgi:hypothetical protein